MDRVERSSLVDQSEDALLAALIEGQWQGQLPGVRMLSESLGVSVPTLQAATARLIERGILLSHGPRRRLEISQPAVDAARDRAAGGDNLSQERARTNTKRRVLCLSRESLGRMNHRNLELFSLLRGNNQGWDVRHHVLAFNEAKKPRKQWDRLLETHEPDNLVVFNCNRALARWAVSRDLPIVVVGGDSGDFKIPTIGMSPVPLIKRAIEEFALRGHSRICMPILRLFPALLESTRKVFQEEMEAHGLAFDRNWNTPSSELALPEVMTNMLNRVMADRVPTAVIAMGWRELVAIECFLRDHRLRIPQDISIILLSDEATVEWFQPALTYFKHPLANTAKTVQRWIEGEVRHEPSHVHVSGVLVEGQSVGPPPQRE